MYNQNYFAVANKYQSPLTDGYADSFAVISLNSCKLHRFVADNAGSNTCWVQVHDGYEEPSTNAIPKCSFRLKGEDQIDIVFDNILGLELSNGCVLAVSSNKSKYVGITKTDVDGAIFSAFFSDI